MERYRGTWRSNLLYLSSLLKVEHIGIPWGKKSVDYASVWYEALVAACELNFTLLFPFFFCKVAKLVI